MATVYSPPAGFPHAPEIDGFFTGRRFDYDAYSAAVDGWLAQLSTAARAQNPDFDLAGETIEFSVADGRAVYVVWDKTKLIHCPIGDAYRIPDAMERGLRASDIRRAVESRRSLDKLFGRRH